jgi:hypothetical protein
MQTLTDIDRLVFEPPELGCVLYLPGLPGGGDKIYDRSPYGNVGTITGAAWEHLPSGLWCLSYDGVDDKTDCGNSASLQLTTALSLEAWVKTSLTSTGHIISKDDDTNRSFNLFISGSDGKAYGSIFVADAIKQIGAAGNAINDGDWRHVVFTYNKVSLYLYVNTTEADSLSETGNIDNDTVNLTVGINANDASDFSGSIALVRVYNRALSALEIQNHFNQEKHLFGVW